MWKPPDPGEIKINFDGAMFKDSHETGIEVVVQNPHGEIMATMFEKIPMPFSVVILETLAIKRAIIFIHEIGFLKSSFEGDPKFSINALRHRN